ncbi:MAG: PCRF domain-containing protein, partial [Gammaproteobacteria bacterium]
MRSRNRGSDSARYGGIFDYEKKRARLSEVIEALEDPALWEKRDRVQLLAKERAALEREVDAIDGLDRNLREAVELLELAAAEDDTAAVQGVAEDVSAIDERLNALEFQRMFSGEMDPNSAFLDVQA